MRLATKCGDYDTTKMAVAMATMASVAASVPATVSGDIWIRESLPGSAGLRAEQSPYRGGARLASRRRLGRPATFTRIALIALSPHAAVVS